MSELRRGHFEKLPKYPNVISARHAAVEYVRKYLSTHDLKLGVLEEDNFKQTMDIIMRAMIDSWIDGFESARE